VRRRKAVNVPSVFVPQFWEDQDRRLHTAREIGRRVEALRADAGIDSVQKDLLAQRAVFISLLLETAEVRAARTGEFDAGSYTQMVNCLNGLLKALGLEKRVLDAGDLKSYIEARAV
jgi:hypothetical protein